VVRRAHWSALLDGYDMANKVRSRAKGISYYAAF
jgi:hypothetical protein